MTDDNVRLVFANFLSGTVDIAAVSFKTGMVLPKKESLTEKSFLLPTIQLFGAIPERDTDFCTFLYELEDTYFQTMYDCLKKEIGCIQPVSGTQLRYGYNQVQYKMDYCDIHNYWNHPVFPRKKWDGNDWYLRNIALVNADPSAHTLETLAMARLIGRPLNVSEYDHPYPNLYQAEGNVLLAAFGAFQDWDAITQFAWTHSNNYVRTTISPMFDMCSNQAKLAHLPACYSMFVRGDVRRGPGRFVHAPVLALNDEIKMNAQSSTGYHRSLDGFPCDKTLSHAVYTGLDLSDNAKSRPFPGKTRVTDWKQLPESLGSPEKKWIWNEFKEILWDYQKEGAGYVLIDTGGTKAMTGFVRDRSFTFHGLTLQPGKTRLDWLTFTLTRCCDNKQSDSSKETSRLQNESTLAPGTWLLAMTGLVQNTDMVISDLGVSDRISIAKTQNGSLGKAPILCEGIPATLTFTNQKVAAVKAFALDSSGHRQQELNVRQRGNDVQLTLAPEYHTIWYEIVIL